MSEKKMSCTSCGFTWDFGQDNFHSCARVLRDSNKKLKIEISDLKQRNEALEDVDDIAGSYRDLAAKAIDLLMEYSHKENRGLQKEFEEIKNA